MIIYNYEIFLVHIVHLIQLANLFHFDMQGCNWTWTDLVSLLKGDII